MDLIVVVYCSSRLVVAAGVVVVVVVIKVMQTLKSYLRDKSNYVEVFRAT